MTDETTIERAAGHWRGILALNGINENFLRGRHCPCPMCGGKDRFRFTDKLGSGSWICTRCGAGYGIHLLRKFKGWSFRQAWDVVEEAIGRVPREPPRAQRTTSLEERREIIWRRGWDGTRALDEDTNSRRYLISRGITLGHIHDLRESTRGNLLALVRDLAGEPCQLQCTFLTDGRKADRARPRMFVRLPFPDGAAVRLLPASDTLGIAEGIGTALSAAQLFGVPTWAALSTSLLRRWTPPEGVKNVVIFGDNDRSFAGQSAAYHLAQRLAMDERLGLKSVSVEIPVQAGHDWNDVLLRGDNGSGRIYTIRVRGHLAVDGPQMPQPGLGDGAAPG